ncbi:MAG: xylan 1,4-beta-xylosidase [Lachnospiraceae bacterium]|nr:xylan 1,4-beta-xylosidase [Lachnospiraceae bacterium]
MNDRKNMNKLSHHIKAGDTAPFKNNAAFCIGTGRMNLALRHEYHKQLKKVQKEIGFSYIRGHGLFHDDMAVYHTYKTDGIAGSEDGFEKEEYNFTYIDLVFDDYLALGLKPFVELGFMPKQMASGAQTVFWWKGNVTPPSDYDKWARLVCAAIKHWINRYGLDEVKTWPFEVWNEPNLKVFWQDADMPEYFKLYDVTARAVKSCHPGLKVGGPAICGVNDELWMRMFLQYCKENNVPLDFVTRHAYGTEMPEADGHYVYQQLRKPEEFMLEPLGSRAIIDSFPEYKDMEMHITEFNTSYSPLNPVHDTNQNAAYVARLLSELGDSCASYSYWTFGDVFEEAGVAFTPFSGCFGLLTNGSIPKPTYFTYVFYKNLYEKAVAKSENFIITKAENGDLRGIAWNLVLENKLSPGGNSSEKTTNSTKHEFSQFSLNDSHNSIIIDLTIDVSNGTYFLLTKTVDENHCNPLKNWIDMGSPAYPSKQQIKLLRECAKPLITTKQSEVKDELFSTTLNLSANAVCYFELQKIVPQCDRGFRKERVPGAV